MFLQRGERRYHPSATQAGFYGEQLAEAICRFLLQRNVDR
jgi:hypothetical protein